jgi:hypothetical protein
MISHANKEKMDNGFIALISVVIIEALILLISIGVSLRSITESNISLDEQWSNRALSLSNACAEIALMKIESVLNYNGNEIIMIDGDSCEIMPLEGSGNTNRIIKTQSAIMNNARKVEVKIAQISPVMRITSWKEVADF